MSTGMGLRAILVTALLVAMAIAPASVGAQTAAPGQLACAENLQATSGEGAPATTVLHLRGLRTLAGTVRLYGSQRLWTADVGNPTTTANRAGIAEQTALIRTSGPVLALEFQPQWANCSMLAVVRPHAGYDAADPSTGVDAHDAGTTTAPPCDHPFEAARVVHAAEPDTPPMAQQQGILGEVRVGVALDAAGQVVTAAIRRSPSAILNNPALYAARRSTYQPAVVNCRAVPSAYEFVVSFI